MRWDEIKSKAQNLIDEAGIKNAKFTTHPDLKGASYIISKSTKLLFTEVKNFDIIIKHNIRCSVRARSPFMLSSKAWLVLVARKLTCYTCDSHMNRLLTRRLQWIVWQSTWCYRCHLGKKMDCYVFSTLGWHRRSSISAYYVVLTFPSLVLEMRWSDFFTSLKLKYDYVDLKKSHQSLHWDRGK